MLAKRPCREPGGGSLTFRPATRAITDEGLEAVFAVMAEYDAEAAQDLRRRWGDDAHRNVVLAMAWARAHSHVMPVFERRGYGDDPMIVEAAAELGRREVERGNPRVLRALASTERFLRLHERRGA